MAAEGVGMSVTEISGPGYSPLERTLVALNASATSDGAQPATLLEGLARLAVDRAWEGQKARDGSKLTLRRVLFDPLPAGAALVEHDLKTILKLHHPAEVGPHVNSEMVARLAKMRELIGTELTPALEIHGTNRGGNNITSSDRRGDDPTYVRRRLRRDRPDLAERVDRGELSAHAAGIEAGIVKPTATVPIDTPERAIAALARRFTRDELRVALEALP